MNNIINKKLTTEKGFMYECLGIALKVGVISLWRGTANKVSTGSSGNSIRISMDSVICVKDSMSYREVVVSHLTLTVSREVEGDKRTK